MMYIVPFGYLIVRLTWRGYLRTESIWKPNFEMAGDMDLVFGIAGVIWLVFLIKMSQTAWLNLFAGKDFADTEYLWQMNRSVQSF